MLNIIDHMFIFENAVCTMIRVCNGRAGHGRSNNLRRTTILQLTTDNIGSSVQSWIFGNHDVIADEVSCHSCHGPLTSRLVLNDSGDHIIFVTFANHEHINVNTIINIPIYNGEAMQQYELVGLIYFGADHFTSRITRGQTVWYHDGIATGATCIIEGQLSDIGDLKQRIMQNCNLLYTYKSHNKLVRCSPLRLM